MLNCRFRLNNRPLSNLTVDDLGHFPAYSGLGAFKNKLSAHCLEGHGPIPLGRYYIFDRESGGRLGWLYKLLRGDWFALYAIDNRIDDAVWCEKVERGAFRLHPEGWLGISEGCLVVKNSAQYQTLYHHIKGHGARSVSGTDLKAYGVIEVTA